MWKPIFLQDIQSAMILGNTLHVTPRPLNEVAQEYLEKCLGIKEDNWLIQQRQIQDVLKVALRHQPILDAQETLVSFTDSLDVSDRNKQLLHIQIERSTKAACEKAVHDALQAFQAEHGMGEYASSAASGDTTASSGNTASTAAAPSAPSSPACPKRKRGGEMDFPERSSLKSKTSLEKIQFFQHVKANTPENLEDLTVACKSFVSKFIKTPFLCLENHFNNDVNAFCDHHQEWLHTSFKKKNCNGTGASCSTS